MRPGIDQVLAGTEFFDEGHIDRRAGVMGPKHAAATVRARRYDTALLLTNSFSTALVARLGGLVPETRAARRTPRRPTGLVLAPTRELALQVSDAIASFASHLRGLTVLPIYGGSSFIPQLRGLRDGAQVVVGTPGRVMDLMEKGSLDLSGVRFLVLDEADEMLRMGFAEDVEQIAARVPDVRRTALFSATMPAAIKKVAATHLTDPVRISVTPGSSTVATVRQTYAVVPFRHKVGALARVLSVSAAEAAIVFVRTKSAAEDVAIELAGRGIQAAAISGDVAQRDREKLIERLRSGTLDVLVATDVAARGLHIDGVEYVYNYDLPFDAEDYVHRIGRTARLGKEGDAISFACERYAMGLPDIEAFIEQKIPSEPVTAELLTALPRKRAEGVEAEAAEGESVGEIFREAREQRAADEARRGGGRSGSGGGRREGGPGGRGRGGGEGRGRAGGEGGERRGRGPRGPRAEQVEGQAPGAPAAAVEDGKPAAPAPGAAARPEASSGGPQDDAARPPRKRRRRRGGRRVNGEGAPQAGGESREGGGQQPRAERTPKNGGGQGQQAKPAGKPEQPAPAKRKGPRHIPAKAAPPKATPSESGGLISRIGRGLKKLVTRDPA